MRHDETNYYNISYDQRLNKTGFFCDTNRSIRVQCSKSSGNKSIRWKSNINWEFFFQRQLRENLRVNLEKAK